MKLRTFWQGDGREGGCEDHEFHEENIHGHPFTVKTSILDEDFIMYDEHDTWLKISH